MIMITSKVIRVDYAQIIINRIVQLCRQRRISYNRLAFMCGVNQSTIDNIVRGVTKNPRIQTLHHIALGFNMTLAEFLDFPALNDYSFDDEREERDDLNEA